MFGWLKNWLLKKELAKITAQRPENDELLRFSDEYLKRSLKENQDALKVAEKINRANVLSASTRNLKRKIREGLDEADDDDEDEDFDDEDDADNTDDLATQLLKPVIQQAQQKLMSSISPTPTANLPSSSENLPPVSELRKMAASWGFKNLTDEQLIKYAAKIQKDGYL